MMVIERKSLGVCMEVNVPLVFRRPVRVCSLSWVALACLVSVLVLPSPLLAQDDVAAAARAFAQAQTAEMNGDPARAAQLYEMAHANAPAAAALRSALRMRLEAGHMASAATHAANLLKDYGDNPASAELAQPVLDEQAPKLVRVEVTCDKPCVPLVGAAVVVTTPNTEQVFFELPGSIDVSAQFDGEGVESQTQDGAAGQTLSFEFVAPEVKPDVVVQQQQVLVERGVDLPPWIAMTVGGATVVVGGLAIWSGLDTLQYADSYSVYDHDAESTFNKGVGLENRTNALIGVTAFLGVATGVLAILTDWDALFGTEAAAEPGTEPVDVQVSAAHLPGGGFIGVNGSF